MIVKKTINYTVKKGDVLSIIGFGFVDVLAVTDLCIIALAQGARIPFVFNHDGYVMELIDIDGRYSTTTTQLDIEIV